MSIDDSKVLHRLVTGEVSPQDPDVAEALSRSPELRKEYEELTRVSAMLDQAGAEEQDVLSGLDWDKDVPGAAGIDAFLRERLQPPGPSRRLHADAPRPTGVLRRWSVYAAAASVVAAGWAVRQFLSSGEETEFSGREVTLGTTRFTFLDNPGGEMSRGTVQWDFPLPPGGWYEVRVWSAEVASSAAAPLLVRDRLEEPVWTPTEEERERLPERVRIEVLAYDALGDPAGSGSLVRSR